MSEQFDPEADVSYHCFACGWWGDTEEVLRAMDDNTGECMDMACPNCGDDVSEVDPL